MASYGHEKKLAFFIFLEAKIPIPVHSAPMKDTIFLMQHLIILIKMQACKNEHCAKCAG